MQQPSDGKDTILATIKAKIGLGRRAVQEVEQASYEYSETMTTTALTGNGVVGARNRQQLYQKYQQMATDPLVSGAVRLHVTAALGGHETSGDLVFIEANADAKGNSQAEAVIAELSESLAPMFNRIAFLAAYNGAVYGDAYGRIYARKGKGVVGLTVDELMLPPLVIPYEQADKTVVCRVAVGAKLRETLTMDQIARLKMPRLAYLPQPLAVEKAWRMQITENDPDKLPLMPSLVGGSFLADAESQFNNFQSAMAGLVGQRVLDSIDESIFTAQVNGMTTEQRQTFLASIKNMLKKSKEVAEEAVKSGRPVLQRIRHILPVWAEKQLMSMQALNSGGGSGSGRAGNISIEDVLFHAKLLAGSLGIDISMLGFADLMSGGLGEGGFFRTSAQSAERSRCIRVGLSEFFNHIIDVHLVYKTGSTYPANKRPWQVNFFGTISALETERQKTQLDAANTTMLMVQTFQMAKDAGLDQKAMAHLFERVMRLDAKDAALYAAAIEKARKEADAKAAAEASGQFGGGGDGGGAPPFGDASDDEPGDGDGSGAPGAAKPPKFGKK